MSAGTFTKSKYQADYSTTAIHPIRIQPETAECVINGVTNTPPSGDVTNPISAVVSRGQRAKGLVARAVALQTPATGGPSGYKPLGITVIPALTPAFAAAAAGWQPGQSITYLGVTGWVVSGTVRDEVVR